MLTMSASGRGFTATQRESIMSCRPPTWSWHSTVRKSLSVWGTSPKVFTANGQAGYRFSLRKHVVSSHPAGNVPPAASCPSCSASASATVLATRDIASAASCITPLHA
jgi:hypothetical protein